MRGVIALWDAHSQAAVRLMAHVGYFWGFGWRVLAACAARLCQTREIMFFFLLRRFVRWRGGLQRHLGKFW